MRYTQQSEPQWGESGTTLIQQQLFHHLMNNNGVAIFEMLRL